MPRVNRPGPASAPPISDDRGEAGGARAARAGRATQAAAVGKTAAAPGEAAAVVRPWSVYLLACADGTLYAGATNDIARRLQAHARGAVRYTRGRLPVELWWIEEVGAKGPALSREAAIKRLSRPQKLRLGGRAR